MNTGGNHQQSSGAIWPDWELTVWCPCLKVRLGECPRLDTLLAARLAS